MPSKPNAAHELLSLTESERLTHRMGMSLRAGLSLIDAWQAETKLMIGSRRERFTSVLQQIRHGEPLAESMQQAGGFPAMMIQMIRVGEATGELDAVFLRLADHYRNLIRSRRVFYQGIVWPALQLAAAATVISLFFLALHWLQQRTPVFVAPDLFQLGLSPLQNLMLFWCVILAILSFGFVLVRLIGKRSMPAPLAFLLSRIPLVGSTWKRMAMSRFAWGLGAAVDAGMDATGATRLALDSSNDATLRHAAPEVLRSIEQGNTFESSMRRPGVFPDELLQAVDVGERTGQLPESLRRLSEDYDEQSAMSLRRLGQISGLVVSMSVVALLGACIFSMYAGYMDTVTGALQANSKTLDDFRTEALAAIGSEPKTAGSVGSNPSAESGSDNSIIQTRDRMVKEFVDNNQDFKQIESIYKQLGRFGEVSNQEFLDGLLGEPEAVRRYKQQKKLREQAQQSRNEDAAGTAK